MFIVIAVAVVCGMAAVLWWAIKYRRTPFLFFGFSIARADRPVLYWMQIAFYAAAMALVIGVLGTMTLASISN